jgi:glycosyltransferase involved in cell wall biosynthesis
MDSRKLITIIIPAYNPQENLLKTLDSVFNQTYKNIEVILVNDGSKSETEIVYSKAKNLYPQLIIHNFETNKGVAAARNYGISNAKGSYIGFIDQDDLWVENKLAIQARYLEENKDVLYITSRQRYFLSEGVEQTPRWVKEEHMNTSLPGFLFGTFLARQQAFKVVGMLDENLKSGALMMLIGSFVRAICRLKPMKFQSSYC